MCGIVVTLNENRPRTLRAMAEAVRHRGPDSFEVWTNERHGAAACRLAIFGDPHAPMIFHDLQTGRIFLFNGEIYNYPELWAETEKHGLQPRTDLECELLARLYDLYGLDFVTHLEGMFAIVIIDGSDLVLARDRFGIRPLYYTVVGDKVLVCSELKGLLRHPDVTVRLNRSALEETKVFGFVHSPTETFFKGIDQVAPGSVMRLRGARLIEKSVFGSLPPANYIDGRSDLDYNECVRKTRDLVIHATERMFRHGDMDKAIFLSGGLDSSTMVLVAKRYLGHRVHTFTLADNTDSADYQAAKQVAAALDTDHHECIVTLDDYWRLLPDYVAHYESLMAGGVFHIQGGLAFHLISRSVAKDFRVAFSGEGADELFGGYYWIYTHPLGFSDRIRRNLSCLEKNPRLIDTVNQLFPQPEDEAAYRRNLFDDLLGSGLSNYHLQSVDRSGGAFGMEIRPLYLDYDLSQWAMELPIEFKVPDKRTTKRILRDAFVKDYQDIGLDWVTRRLKMGMPSAVAELDNEITAVVERAIADDELERHPLGRILGSKMNLLLFDLFEHIFFKGWNHHDTSPPAKSMLARVWPT